MKPAKSVMVFLPYLKANGIYRVLDYGAGKLRNSLYLAQQGFYVVATDCKPPARSLKEDKRFIWVAKEVISARILKKADLVICNFVINIVETLSEREELMHEITDQLRPGGFLLLETRENRAVEQQTARHAMSKDELDRLAAGYGCFAVMLFRGRQSLAVLYKKNKVLSGEESIWRSEKCKKR